MQRKIVGLGNLLCENGEKQNYCCLAVVFQKMADRLRHGLVGAEDTQIADIEGFRSLNTDIETIINKSEAVKKTKTNDKKLTPKKKKELTEAEKEYKSMRKQIQDKLIKFATRVPLFMYLTDYRERCLQDVITQLEPDLFKKVTGLNVKDFELLCSIGVFNASLMNDAIFKFKRYEDASLSYTGIDKHVGKDIGGWDTVIKREEYERLFFNQQLIMEQPDEFIEDEKTPLSESDQTDVPTTAKQDLITEYFGIKAPGPAQISKDDQSQDQKEEVIDLTGVIVGTVVIHKNFGMGTVTRIDKAKIRVKFNVGEKIFLYPNAFRQGYLKL